MKERKGETESGSPRSPRRVIFVLLPSTLSSPSLPLLRPAVWCLFSTLFRPTSLSTIRCISAHPRHCFRGISRVSLYTTSSRFLPRDDERDGPTYLSSDSTSFRPSRSRCYETEPRERESVRSRIQITAYLNLRCIFR